MLLSLSWVEAGVTYTCGGKAGTSSDTLQPARYCFCYYVGLGFALGLQGLGGTARGIMEHLTCSTLQLGEDGLRLAIPLSTLLQGKATYVRDPHPHYRHY